MSTRSQAWVWRLAALALASMCADGAAAQTAPDPSSSRPNALIVKLRGEGAHAVEACAARTFARKGRFQDVTSDGSPSLDEALERVGARRVRALFRRPDGRPFALQRARLRDRLARKLDDRAAAPDLAHVYLVELSEETSVEQARALLARDPHVEYVQRDHEYRLDQVPSAPDFDDPFLHSTGSWGQAYQDLWGLWRIRAPEAWAFSQGEGIVVAVVDTGLDYDHPDIADNVWVNPGEDLDGNGRVDASDWNGIDDDGNGFVDDLHGYDFANSVDVDQDGSFDGPEDTADPDPFDDHGHGTHVSGTIAAAAGNGKGIAGVAPRARIMAVKGFRAEGSGRDSDLWRGVLYAAENGASVINTSWSCFPLCPVNLLGEEIVRLVHAMDVVIVTSAGNRNTDIVFNSPESMRETITVAASGEDDELARDFSNFGLLVDLAAPGGGPHVDPSVRVDVRNILSLRSSADTSEEFATVAEGYWRNRGTSMATPHVAGVVALLRSAQPELGYEEIRRILRESAVDRDAPGHDRRLGSGRLDALAAVTLPPLPDLFAAITGPRQGSSHSPGPGGAIEIEGTAAGSDLLGFELHYGLGNEPPEWFPIEAAATGPVERGVLARWPLDGLAEGTYVVRLEVEGHSGARYAEFLIVSLERNEFVRISPEGPPALSPSIAGEIVVWESRRSGSDPQQSSDDANLFASDFRGSRHVVVSDAPGDQRLPSIAGRTISWMDSRNELGGSEIFGCLLGKRTCESFPVSNGETVSLPPASTPRRIFWIDGSSGTSDIRACQPKRGRCIPSKTGLAPLSRSFLRTDGASLVWTQAAGAVGLCRVDRVTGRCPATIPESPHFPFSRVAISGSLLGWVSQVSPSNPRSLQVCELDSATGSCPAIEVAQGVLDVTPSLSGNRLVWETSAGTEAADVYYCELDRIRQRCPVQRLTAHHAPQSDGAIDGRRVVWADERNGLAEIHGILLPGLASLRDRRVFEGQHLTILVRQEIDDPMEFTLTLGFEAIREGDVQDPQQLGARFRQLPGRFARGLFQWRPERGQAGVYAITFEGRTETGLVTRETLEVSVLARPGKGSSRSGRR